MVKTVKPPGNYPNNGHLNRRSFLKMGGAGLAALTMSPFLKACSSGTASPTRAEVGGSMDFLSWEGYDLPGCMDAWKAEKGVNLSPTYIGDHNEIQAKLSAAQSAGYDLTSYYQGFSELYIHDLKILQPIDRAQVPNLSKLYKIFQAREFWVDEENTLWGVPFTWGIEGCNYNADKTGPPASWHDLLKPEYKGLVGMVDELYGNVILGGRAIGLGDSLPNLSQAELSEIRKFLLTMKKQARGIAPSFGDLTDMLVSGEITITFPGWAAVNVWAAERGANIQHTLPKEGGYTFIDAYAIPTNADNAVTAMAWMNHAISPEIQACQAVALSAGVVNPEAVPLLDSTVASMYDYNNIDNIFTMAPFYSMPPREKGEYATYDDWLSMWEDVKAT
jgi:spermidine/putrescine transport system substrate-binding protein